MGLRMKTFSIMGVLWKIRFFFFWGGEGGDASQKKQDIGGKSSKKVGGLDSLLV